MPRQMDRSIAGDRSAALGMVAHMTALYGIAPVAQPPRQRGSHVRTRLPAGGSEIRTHGPAPLRSQLACRVMQYPAGYEAWGSRGGLTVLSPAQTLCWREMDSNHRSLSRRNWFVLRNSNWGDRNGGSPQRVVPLRGTDGSNPSPSSGESATNRFRGSISRAVVALWLLI